jgi:hypothetical protein
LSLVSKRSIIRDTVAIPALTSLLTSDPRSVTELFRENHLSFHPLVLLEIDSLYLKRQEKFEVQVTMRTHQYHTDRLQRIVMSSNYLVDTAFSFDFRDSEND